MINMTVYITVEYYFSTIHTNVMVIGTFREIMDSISMMIEHFEKSNDTVIICFNIETKVSNDRKCITVKIY